MTTLYLTAHNIGSAGIEGGDQPVLDLPALADEAMDVTASLAGASIDLANTGGFKSVFVAFYADAALRVCAAKDEDAAESSPLATLPANTLVVYRVPVDYQIFAKTL